MVVDLIALRTPIQSRASLYPLPLLSNGLTCSRSRATSVAWLIEGMGTILKPSSSSRSRNADSKVAGSCSTGKVGTFPFKRRFEKSLRLALAF